MNFHFEQDGAVVLHFSPYLNQEEGDAVCPQRSRQFDIFDFCFDLCHFATVVVLLLGYTTITHVNYWCTVVKIIKNVCASIKRTM